MNEQFKAGDEVYCPSIDTAIHVLTDQRNRFYPVMVEGTSTFTEDGRVSASSPLQSIFHATPENKALLEALYKCEFESPKLKGSDLTRKLLSEGRHVLCYVSDLSDRLAITKKKFALVVHTLCGDFSFEDTDGVAWKYAVPFNDYANLPDGVLIKSEQ